MKQTKSKLSKYPFELIGYNIDIYLKWCEKHQFKSYLNSTKKEFFKRINDYTITKRCGIVYEDGKEL